MDFPLDTSTHGTRSYLPIPLPKELSLVEVCFWCTEIVMQHQRKNIENISAVGFPIVDQEKAPTWIYKTVAVDLPPSPKKGLLKLCILKCIFR